MRRSLDQFSGMDALCRMPWSADCIINTTESLHTPYTRPIGRYGDIIAQLILGGCTIDTPGFGFRKPTGDREVRT